MANVVAEIDQADINALMKAIGELRAHLGTSTRVAMRRATIDLIKSLRARSGGTRVSKKQVALGDIEKSNDKPKYITKQDGTVLRRFDVRRWGYGKSYKAKAFIPVMKRARGKSGKMVMDVSRMRREARARVGQIRNWGLARKSWGWFMKTLFNRSSNGGDNPNVQIDRRMVAGGITEKRKPLSDGTISLATPIYICIEIVNKLEYIRKAIWPGAVPRAVEKAKNSILAKIKKGVLEGKSRFGQKGYK